MGLCAHTYSLLKHGDCMIADIAVGAPYEVSDDGNTGAVYIYYGASSESGLISQSPDQVRLHD